MTSTFQYSFRMWKFNETCVANSEHFDGQVLHYIECLGDDRYAFFNGTVMLTNLPPTSASLVDGCKGKTTVSKYSKKSSLSFSALGCSWPFLPQRNHTATPVTVSTVNNTFAIEKYNETCPFGAGHSDGQVEHYIECTGPKTYALFNGVTMVSNLMANSTLLVDGCMRK